MAYRTTIGWSLLTSGIVTLVLGYLPGTDFQWGTVLLVAGIVTLYIRQ